jgi:hypothetical protein
VGVRSSVSALIACVIFATVALAQQSASVSRPYDGIQAGLDAFRLAEEKRQGAASDQLFLNDQMRFWNGYPNSRGETIYYGYLSPAAIRAYGYDLPPAARANLDYAYAHGGVGGPLAVFQPWPFVPGDIWGYGARYQPARQPIGQQQVQTGPNRWESHPVYDPPLTQHQPLPPMESRLLDRTPFATANETLPQSQPIPMNATVPDAAPAIAPPTPAPRRVPREY